jgi:hypothetical protein
MSFGAGSTPMTESEMNIGCGMALIRATAMAVLAALLSLALVMPALGGIPQCTLQATVGGGSATEVEVGEEVLIEGFGFPGTVDVDLVYMVGATVIGGETVTTDGSGFFETTVTPLAGQEGTWTVTATVVKGCTADTGFLVVAGPTPTPSPTPTPVAATRAPTPEGELPDVATNAPDGPSPLVLVGLALIAASVRLTRPLLARRLR